ncbi:hypothetical protein [Lysinibacillus contaminans]|uniref:hypothetical protein n=1 Tax=Lysinibacillus contaminans TaxID=1293441 RepID=UPI0006AE1D71|nr:hypothetical protein [Lysinibacillus contaminans]
MTKKIITLLLIIGGSIVVFSSLVTNRPTLEVIDKSEFEEMKSFYREFHTYYFTEDEISYLSFNDLVQEQAIRHYAKEHQITLTAEDIAKQKKISTEIYYKAPTTYFEKASVNELQRVLDFYNVTFDELFEKVERVQNQFLLLKVLESQAEYSETFMEDTISIFRKEYAVDIEKFRKEHDIPKKWPINVFTKAYDTSTLNTTFFEPLEAYEIVVNDDGIPVFKNPHSAMERIIYGEHRGLEAISEQFDLEPMYVGNIHLYKQYGWQVESTDEEVVQSGQAITAVLDIYDNSYPERMNEWIQ